MAARTGGAVVLVAPASPQSIPRESWFMIDQLLEGNLEFVEKEYRPNADYYQTIAAKQTPKVLWIGCSDSRVSEHQMTG